MLIWFNSILSTLRIFILTFYSTKPKKKDQNAKGFTQLDIVQVHEVHEDVNFVQNILKAREALL